MEAFPLRLKRGEELKSCLINYILANGLKSAFILTCCGSISNIHLRFASKIKDGEMCHKEQHFDEYMEILSLSGTICVDGAHLHVSLGRADGSVVGGHILGNMIVQTTAEIIIGATRQWIFSRKFDDETGYNELNISFS